MGIERIHRDMKWTPEDHARHKAIRGSSRRSGRRLSNSSRVASTSGRFRTELTCHSWPLFTNSRKPAKPPASASRTSPRNRASTRPLSRLENGVHDNPTVETLMHDAAALGKKLSWTLQDFTPASK